MLFHYFQIIILVFSVKLSSLITHNNTHTYIYTRIERKGAEIKLTEIRL